MRLDVITIFPEYLEPLNLSLIGKARDSGLLDIHVHDLRTWTHDRHNTVDDTPYGGGAGMVMKPQPWAEALAEVVPADSTKPVVIVPGPGGQPFTQTLARELAEHPRLLFACGRYEGIDERVYDHARDDLGLDVRVVSLGDYVLNGGEVAVLAMTEAIVRLVPGVIGNEESLVEESHEDGLLEYPVYTKPAAWTAPTADGGEATHEVPAILLSGNHAAIAQWRHQQRLQRTAERRPDLLHATHALTIEGLDDADVHAATASDAGEIYTLLCASRTGLTTTLAEVSSGLGEGTTLVLRSAGRLVAAGRARLEGDAWRIEAPIEAPDLTGLGLASWLITRLADLAPSSARRIVVRSPHARDEAKALTKALSKHGFRARRGDDGDVLEKRVG